MSIESNPDKPQPIEMQFGLTEQERLWDRISEERFQGLLKDESNRIHSVELAANTYGEFLFVRMGKTGSESKFGLTFWGLGFHEYRERWILDEWFWYRTNLGHQDEVVSVEDTLKQLLERRDEIARYGTSQAQSRRGELFEMLADLTDDDGAWAALDDLDSLF